MLKRRQQVEAAAATGGGRDDLEEAHEEETHEHHRVNHRGILLSLLSLLLLLLFYFYSKDSGETMALIKSLTTSGGTPQGGTAERGSMSHILAINEPSTTTPPVVRDPSPDLPSSEEKPLPSLSAAVVPKPITPMDPPPPADHVDLSELETEALELVQQLRKMKTSGVVMETDPSALTLIPKAQSLLREVLLLKYGPGPHYVSMGIKFPLSMTRPDLPQETNLILELGPIEFIPYSVYFFLEFILQEFKTGSFHRNAGHVLQAMLTGTKPQIAFAWQEYSPRYPHEKYTLGYAGRPSGSRAIYISTVDNTNNHGPGSQGSKTEADCLFGKVTKQSYEIVQRMAKQPGAAGGAGWVSDPNNYITITSLELLPSSYRPAS